MLAARGNEAKTAGKEKISNISFPGPAAAVLAAGGKAHETVL